MNRNSIEGYLLAFFTVFIWATTYIFTKNLLKNLTPYEILFYRFTLAYLILCIIYPKFNFDINLKEELLFLTLGFLGVTAYYLLENIALKYTQASNVGLIVSSIPIFTATIAHFMHEDEPFHKHLLYGFIFSILGIFLVIFNGKYILNLNPLGDILALIAAIIFSIYSSLLKKTDNKLKQLLVIRKIFFYGLITMIPIVFYNNVRFEMAKLWQLNILSSFLFLSLLASILAFIMWSQAIKLIGATKTSTFIYLVPLITMISSSLFLAEEINGVMIGGGILILFGVYLSERRTI
ncbi:drug/metabolite transporter (DMT)-like permease [Orenia metallireducens]|uniref:Permease of the drug/metabolite transporter (DMT) superfamily n=1 Tax=Orenia metallireducens TaxID=1413210 RepID=A0A285FMD6_9FIRM|nr:DMT family transporter [Orenia metallireducens]PRX33613.1 drug/metabolite transporter (DMT)-like permease [Orenia metallireducens]SNY11994.1 Permease of the drug/metabolite transporter (DMT) superfamily [Orenia metallireducens]